MQIYELFAREEEKLIKFFCNFADAIESKNV